MHRLINVFVDKLIIVSPILKIKYLLIKSIDAWRKFIHSEYYYRLKKCFF